MTDGPESAAIDGRTVVSVRVAGVLIAHGENGMTSSTNYPR